MLYSIYINFFRSGGAVMKNNLKKLIAAALIFMSVFSCFSAGAFADEVGRVSCSMYGGGAAGRGFCWFTS